jgi:hypothetical protein
MSERRFVVRAVALAAEVINRFPELDQISYKAWDTKADRIVPFGSYSSVTRAQARADREEEKVKGS